ncbi:PREDICTED: probable WRKY transcription factor 43 [Nelumbo nucifera]|uniref:Probable WRKY transcription factor 43 n=1 Tax=Nelumbo nucifera TaxID=4432 RepID=A0A1U7Z2E5_NELNU|nr:PREDICTED: probable WRKY transcription factor 43 [Nelumbo nucifera]
MEGEAPPPLPPLPPSHINPSYFFTPSSALGSTLLHPPPPPTPLPILLHQPHQQDSQIIPDIDWVSLLSGSLGFGEQKPLLASAAVTTGNQIEEEKGGKDKARASRTKKASRPRLAFQTRSTEDILDDGFRWRKYGQKAVKNSSYPRSYYRCTHHTCNVKKQVQRLSKDTSIVVTTYEGIHNHPCEKLMESLSPFLKQMQFFTRF